MSQQLDTCSLYSVWQSGNDCGTPSMTTRETVTALTTIHRHHRSASHKILEWWSWHSGGTEQRQNLCALVVDFGRMKSDVCVREVSHGKGRDSLGVHPSLSYIYILVSTARERVRLWKQRFSHKTKNCLSESTKQEYENCWLATHLVWEQAKANQSEATSRCSLHVLSRHVTNTDVFSSLSK